MSDWGLRTSLPGSSVFGDAGINFDTSNPFLKIDTQNPQGFKTTLLLLINDPPEPVAPDRYRYTIVHQFKHGYAYKPSLESLFYMITPPATAVVYQRYFQDSGAISLHSLDDSAQMWAVCDKTWVYIVVGKYRDPSFGSPNPLNGCAIQITTHVFVEDIGP